MHAEGYGSAPAVVRGPRLRGWIWIGVAGWLAVAVLWVVASGIRRVAFGFPFYTSWTQLGFSVATVGIGALLSPLVVLALRRLRSAALRPATLALAYVALGIAFWMAWSLGLALLLPAPGVDLSERLMRSVVLGALINLTIYTVLVMLFEAYWHLHEARLAEVEAAKLQAELSAAEAAAVNARLNPALLFDSLETASELMERDPRGARKVLADLSELLRVSMGRDGSHAIRLRDELHLLQRFLDIRLARSESLLEVRVDVPESVLDWLVPPLILMTLVDELTRDGRLRPRTGSLLTLTAEPLPPDRLRLLLALRSPGGRDEPSPLEGRSHRIAEAESLLRGACGSDSSIRFTSTSGRAAVELRISRNAHERSSPNRPVHA